MDDLHVFGAGGAVGSFLIARLRAEQHRATAWLHSSPAPPVDDADGIRWRRIDLWRDSQPSSATAAISAGPLDAFASWLKRVATPHLQRVVALSSMSIDSKRDSADAGERALAERLRNAEQLLRDTCAERGIAWTILRPTLIWGAGRDVSLTPLYRFGRRFGFVPTPLVAGGLRQPVHVDDVAHACMAALRQPTSIGMTIAVGGLERLPVSQMWSRVARAAEARCLRLPTGLLRLGSVFLGQGGNALRQALQRWHTDQSVVTASAADLLQDWHPRAFNPAATDFDIRA